MADSPILAQIVRGIQRTPGNIVGAPVDITNLLMGAMAGHGLSGFVERPVGGSESINSLFGLDNKPTDPIPTAQGVTEFVTSLVNPSGISKAMIVGLPMVMRTGAAMEKFAQMEQAGKSAAEMFKETKIYAGEKDKLLRTALSDKDAIVNEKAFDIYQGKIYPNNAMTVGDVLKHDKLFEQYPQLKNIKVDVMRGEPGEAAYNPAKNTIFLAGANGYTEIRRAILHELQHGVQKTEGFSRGTSIPEQLGATGRDIVSQLRKEQAVATSDKQKSVLQEKIDALMNGAAQRYKHAPGEQEAAFTHGLASYGTQGQLEQAIEGLLRDNLSPQSWLTNLEK